jgi:hypothetical protein
MISEIKQELKSKDIFIAKSEDPKFEIKSREVFKNKNYEIVYPFNNKNGNQKYNLISEIHFDGIEKSDLKGVLNLSSGYGFTKNTVSLISVVNEKFTGITKIIISNKETELDIKKGSIIININDFQQIFSIIRPKNQTHSKDIKITVNNVLAKNKSLKLGIEKIPYTSGTIKSILQEVKVSNKKISESDSLAIIDFTKNHIQDHSIKLTEIISTKEEIDKIYIDKVFENFEKILSKKTGKNLEGEWHKFFKENSWIFSYLFSAPHFLFQDEYYVGGQKGTGKGGRYADFIYTNKLTGNATIIEIKTHKTNLINRNTYRKAGNIYAISSELSGAINQVLDQKHTLLREYLSVADDKFEVFEPKCIIIAGQTENLTKDQKKNIELFRQNLKNIDTICFDELLTKSRILLNQISKKK